MSDTLRRMKGLTTAPAAHPSAAHTAHPSAPSAGERPPLLDIEAVDHVPPPPPPPGSPFHQSRGGDGVTLANFSPHHVSSPKHLNYSPKSISASLALRQQGQRQGGSSGDSSPLSPRARSASFVMRQSSFGTFEGFSAEARQDTSVTCVASAPCSPMNSRQHPATGAASPSVSLSPLSLSVGNLPRGRSPQSIAASLLLRKHLLASYSPYSKSNAGYCKDFNETQCSSPLRNDGHLHEMEKLFDDEDDIFHGFLFQPKPIRRRRPDVGRVIRSPLARLRHGNRNYFDAASQTWRPAVVG
jgi:hypothetical protein